MADLAVIDVVVDPTMWLDVVVPPPLVIEIASVGAQGPPGPMGDLPPLPASTLFGRGSLDGTGQPEAITLGAGLVMTGTTISAPPPDPVPPEPPLAHAASHQVGGSDPLGDLHLARLGVGLVPAAPAIATFSGQYYSPLVPLVASGAARTIDWALGNEHEISLTADCTLTFASPVLGGRYVLLVRQTGAFAITWPSTVKWAQAITPTVTPTAGRVDLFTFMYSASGEYLGAYSQNY